MDMKKRILGSYAGLIKLVEIALPAWERMEFGFVVFLVKVWKPRTKQGCGEGDPEVSGNCCTKDLRWRRADPHCRDTPGASEG